MKVLHLVKYYLPSKGGMETVVGNIVNGISSISGDLLFTVYTNSHYKSNKDQIWVKDNEKVITKGVRYFFKNQPLNFFFKELRSLISESDVIHLHYPYPNIELSLIFLLSLLNQKNFIITWHANIERSRWNYLAPIYNIIIGILLKRANYVVVTSPNLFENSKLLSSFANKVIIIPLSFSTTYINSCKDNVRSLGTPPRLLFVGKLRKYKGVEVLIKSILALDVKLTIVGEGPELESLTKLCHSYNMVDKVIFKDSLSNTDLLKEYKLADVFILPSINEAEAFGIVQLEAMSLGLPVINTRLNSGVPFVSLHNITGYTVQPNNIIELKDAIVNICADNDRYIYFSNNAKTRALEFTTEKMAFAYVSLYKK